MRSEDNVHLLVKGGIMGALHHLFCTQEESVGVMEAATECAAIIARHPFHSHLLLDSSVAQDVLTALRHYPENERIVQAGLTSFHALIGQAPTGQKGTGALSPRGGKALKEAVMGMEGLTDTLITAIECHPDNDALLDSGAECLRALSDGDDLRLLLSVNPGNNAATASAVSKVSSLLLVESNVDVLVKGRGVEWLMRAMQAAQAAHADGDANAHTASILTSGARALQRLCVDEQRIYALMQQGAVKALVRVLETHKADHDLTTTALKALTSMATREDNAFYIAKLGAVKACQGVQAAHPLSDKVAQRIAELNARLAAYPKCADVQVQEGVVHALVAQINQRSAAEAKAEPTRRVVLAALNALTRLGRHDGVRAEVTQGAVVSAVAGLLRVNAAQPEVVQRCVELLTLCAASPSAVTAMKADDAGVMAAVVAAMDAQKDSEAVQSACTQLLSLLNPAGGVSASSQVAAALGDTSALAAAAGAAGTATAPGALDALLANVTAVSHLSMMDANAVALVEAGAVKRLVEAFNAAARMNAAQGHGARVGVMSAAAGTVHRLMKERPVRGVPEHHRGRHDARDGVGGGDGGERGGQRQCDAAHRRAGGRRGRRARDDGGRDDAGDADAGQGAPPERADRARHDGRHRADGAEPCAHRAHRGVGQRRGADRLAADAPCGRAATQATLRVIDTVTATKGAIPSFLSMDSIAAILDIIRIYAAQPDILTLSMQCLAHLLVNEEAAEEVGRHNGCTLLVKAMREHYTSEELCEVDMLLLDSLSTHPANVDLLLEPDLATVELVKWVAQKYGKNRTLVDAGQRLLQALDVKKPQLVDSAADSAQCDLILTKLRNPALGSPDACHLFNSLATLVHAAETADGWRLRVA